VSEPDANAAPRPEGELAALEAVWQPPRGWRVLSDVNNTTIGLLYIATALLFFLLAGALALLMRLQLAGPERDLLGQDVYNQLFTMHGTVMMFLFAVPAVEAMGVLLLPNLLAARDLPFPRLGAYAYWAYAVGGLLFFGSLFFGVAPDGGWFMYPPLTSYEFSPGPGADFWLLGIGFIEISAIAGAIEIVVGVLRTRAPGMTLDKLPVYAWAMLVLAALIVLGFPAVILGTALLEIERSFRWPFFIAAQGGDPLLWQHLFWFFGHPEVYIIFLPAAGFVSTILPALCGVPLVGYRLVVLSLVATGFSALGVWAHHMFTTGIPEVSVGFFSAASMAVAVPSGVQVFAWIATLAAGRLRPSVPALFALGFAVLFTIGGLTGVMVGVVPFDWQVHDTYFIVAHLHYVLIGGMVFPLFGAFYYWAPMVSRTPLSERLGRWVFGLMFVGFNLAFFPMHVAGLLGMPRRIFSYPAELGWEAYNLASTCGAFVLAAGVLCFLVDLALHFRPQLGGGAGNVWGAGTLEWLPTGTYGVRSIPRVASREPLWDDSELAERAASGRGYLPGSLTGRRETLVTSARDAQPEYVLQLPGPGWAPFAAACFTAFAFFALTLKLAATAALCAAGALGGVLYWLWSSDPGTTPHRVAIGGGLELPVNASGARSHSGWAVIVLLVVCACTFGALLFAYVYLRLAAPHVWPAATGFALPALGWPAASAGLLAASSAAIALAGRGLGRRGAAGRWSTRLGLVAAVALLAAALALELAAHLRSGLAPTQSSYGALVYMVSALLGANAAAAALMALYALARSCAGLLHGARRATYDNTALFWHYTVSQGFASLALVHLAPRWLA
jgi:cytochrome c oxidase subunit I+III